MPIATRGMWLFDDETAPVGLVACKHLAEYQAEIRAVREELDELRAW